MRARFGAHVAFAIEHVAARRVGDHIMRRVLVVRMVLAMLVLASVVLTGVAVAGRRDGLGADEFGGGRFAYRHRVADRMALAGRGGGLERDACVHRGLRTAI